MKVTNFLLIIATLFFVERLLPLFSTLPILIFPFFAIIYLGLSKDFSSDLARIAAASLLFDIFSGFSFGIFTISIMILGGLIYLVRRFVSISGSDLIFYLYVAVFAVIQPLLFIYFLPFSYVISQLPLVIAEALAFGFIFKMLINKLQKHEHSR